MPVQVRKTFPPLCTALSYCRCAIRDKTRNSGCDAHGSGHRPHGFRVHRWPEPWAAGTHEQKRFEAFLGHFGVPFTRSDESGEYFIGGSALHVWFTPGKFHIRTSTHCYVSFPMPKRYCHMERALYDFIKVLKDPAVLADVVDKHHEEFTARAQALTTWGAIRDAAVNAGLHGVKTAKYHGIPEIYGSEHFCLKSVEDVELVRAALASLPEHIYKRG